MPLRVPWRIKRDVAGDTVGCDGRSPLRQDTATSVILLSFFEESLGRPARIRNVEPVRRFCVI
jgi:hypothetical protein